MTFATISFLIVLILSFLLIAALMSRRDNRLANTFLSLVLAGGFFIQFIQALRLSGNISKYPFLKGAGIPVAFLIPSLLYLYILALTEPGFRFGKRHLVHLIPFAFGLLIYGLNWFFFLSKGDILQREHLMVGIYVGSVLSSLNTGIYLCLDIRRLDQFNRELVNQFSQLRRVRLRWLTILVILFSLPWLVQVADVLSGPFITLEIVLVPVLSVIFLLIGFFGLRQSIIFGSEGSWGKVSTEPLAPADPEKHQKSPIFFSEEELTEWKAKLENHMVKTKPFLEPELRLVDLAGQLGLKPYELSEVLNKGLGMAFYDYVNGYRVEEAKRRLLDSAYAHMNILGIANESGFNSKSVFNETFRKYTKTTPSSFRAGPAAAAKVSPKDSRQ